MAYGAQTTTTDRPDGRQGSTLAVRGASRSPRVQSALSNGTRMHLGRVDGRSAAGRRFTDLVRTLEAERGGAESLDVGRRQAIRAYAQLVVERELMEAQRAAGRAIDPETYGQLCDRADRQLRRMGPLKAPERQSVRERYAKGRTV